MGLHRKACLHRRLRHRLTLALLQLTIRLCEGRFTQSHDVTIGVEFGSRVVPVGPPASLALQNPSSTTPSLPAPSSTSAKDPDPRQKHMKLSLWDTAGQETYKSVTRSYFRGASGALLVYDITRRNTFEHVTDWLHDLRQIAEPDIVVILVGNKSDLAPEDEDDHQSAPSDSPSEPPSTSTTKPKSRRAVPVAEAQHWCKTHNVLKYVETSAKSGDGVERAFLEVAERIWQNIEAGKYDLNDRRSGVKGAGQSRDKSRTVNLGGVGRGGGKNARGQAGWSGGCC
ncbi:MAG: hypothetical protein M1817_004701 [Caeruleum heppii]|nr:MAG: hypothetical protein M1817_004701 [Caeruleum heppii]